MVNELKLLGKLIISSEISTESGLHIGGSNEGLDIGGVDNAVIKLKNGKPYIPGSSLKGKLRSLSEKKRFPLNRDNFEEKKPHSCNLPECSICKIFGRDAKDSKEAEEPVRIIVRDCSLIKSDENVETEIKAETAIDRITSAANPRKMERVPAGTKFKSEILLNIFRPQDKELLADLLAAMKLLEDDYLGGSGSRGSGKVKFINFEIEYRDIKYYEGEDQQGVKVDSDIKTLKEFEEKLDDVKGLIKNEVD